MNTVDFFRENGFVQFKNFVDLETCYFASTYALMKEDVEFSPEYGEFAQNPNTHSVYADTYFEVLLDYYKPEIEKISGFNLESTYSFYRVYRPGAKLQRGFDRDSCEINALLTLRSSISKQDQENYNWSMFLQKYETDSQIEMQFETGDLLLYKGREMEHWREPFDADPESFQVQVFLHYINKEGPLYPALKFDGRNKLGENCSSIKERTYTKYEIEPQEVYEISVKI